MIKSNWKPTPVNLIRYYKATASVILLIISLPGTIGTTFNSGRYSQPPNPRAPGAPRVLRYSRFKILSNGNMIIDV